MINFSLPVRGQSGGPHFSESPVHVPFMETRGVVAMHGTFGYEMDLSKCTPEEKEIARRQTALPVRGQSGGPPFSEAPVHVPFQIRDIGAGQDRLDLLIYMIAHIPP